MNFWDRLKEMGVNIIKGSEVEPERREKRTNFRHDEKGHEILDGTPVEPPIGYQETEPLHVLIARLVGNEMMKRELADEGFETLDEAEDFYIDDDDYVPSPYDVDFEPSDASFRRALEEEKEPGPDPIPAPSDTNTGPQ